MLADGSRYYCVIIVPIIWNIVANNNLLRTCIRCIRYYPNVVTPYNNIPCPFRIMRLQGIPVYRCLVYMYSTYEAAGQLRRPRIFVFCA